MRCCVVQFDLPAFHSSHTDSDPEEFKDFMVRQAVGSHNRERVQKALALCHTLEQMDDNRHMLFAPPAVFETVAWCHDFQYKDKQYLQAELENNCEILSDFMNKFQQLEGKGKTDGLTFKNFLLRKDYREFNLLCVPVFTRNVGMLRHLLKLYIEVFGEGGVKEIASEIVAMDLIGENESEVLMEQLDSKKWQGNLRVEMVPEPNTIFKAEATKEEKAASDERKRRNTGGKNKTPKKAKGVAAKVPSATRKNTKAVTAAKLVTKKAKKKLAKKQAVTDENEKAVKVALASKSRAERAARRQSS